MGQATDFHGFVPDALLADLNSCPSCSCYLPSFDLLFILLRLLRQPDHHNLSRFVLFRFLLLRPFLPDWLHRLTLLFFLFLFFFTL